jgi:phospholipid/cholesterol/gamma-HCH transport system substrate-binding protein
MRDNAIEYKVGLLVIGAVVLFAAFVFVLGNFSLGSGYTVYVDYRFSGNVQVGAPVKVSGIAVGRVEQVSFHGGRIDPATGRRVQVRVELWIEERARDSVRRDAEFFINTAGVLGEQYVEIVPGEDWEAPPLAAGSIVLGVDPPRTDLVVARLYDVLDTVSMVLREDRDKLRSILDSGASAIDEVNHILVENREEVGQLIGAVTGLARESEATLAKVNAGLEPAVLAKTMRDADALLVTADRVLGEMTPDARAFLGEATRVAGLVTEPRVERALGAVDRASAAAGEAGALLTNANGLVADLRAGKGTAGALLARDELYADLRELIRDLRRHPWKVFWKE